MQRTVTTPIGELQYEWERKAVKNLNLRLLPDGGLRVSGPRRATGEEADRFVRDKAAWIARARERQAARLTATDGAAVYLLGRRLSIERFDAPKDAFEADGDTLRLLIRDPDDEDKRLALIKAFLEREGERVFPGALDRMAALVRPLGVAAPRMTTRWCTGRWGSCSPAAGRISINKALVCTPPPCVELVMLHELVHFLHPDHGAAFHRQMEALLPDCRQREREIRRYSPRLEAIC